MAASGEEAVAAVKQHDASKPYDLVFMDWRMQGIDGLEAARSIRGDATIRRKPVVVMVTAFGREEVRDEAEELGIEGFLVKPVTRSMLVDTLVTLFAPEAAEAAEAIQAEEQPDLLAGVRILLAEDNEINQQIAVELLEGVGARVQVAGNGRVAVEALLAAPTGYDVVLMDLQMPEMDGYQATAQIREDARFTELPILAMTAHATIEERQQCLAAGMNDHIAKPIDPGLLFDTVARHCVPRRGDVAIERDRPAEGGVYGATGRPGSGRVPRGARRPRRPRARGGKPEALRQAPAAVRGEAGIDGGGDHRQRSPTTIPPRPNGWPTP